MAAADTKEQDPNVSVRQCYRGKLRWAAQLAQLEDGFGSWQGEVVLN